jgi:hypothetical protein
MHIITVSTNFCYRLLRFDLGSDGNKETNPSRSGGLNFQFHLHRLDDEDS